MCCCCSSAFGRATWLLFNRERERERHTKDRRFSWGTPLRFFLNFLFRVFGTFRVLAEKKKRRSRYFLREKKYLRPRDEKRARRPALFLIGERTILFSFVLLWSFRLLSTTWGKGFVGRDDDVCVREKEGGRRAMTVKKKANTTRLAAGRGDPTRVASKRARRGGKNGGGNKGLRHVKYYFYSSLVINFLRRSSFFRLLSLRSPFFFAPIFFPSFFLPFSLYSGVTNSAHFCRVFVRVYFRDGRKNVARIGRF